jgi:hypothetical protein
MIPSTGGAQELPKSTAFPGSFWTAAGDVGPAEPDNVIYQAGFEQGIVAWQRGSWFLVPHVSLALGTDSLGYDWNNKHPTILGVKLVRKIGGGVVQGGGGLLFERDPATGRERHPTAFVHYWTGWTVDRRSHQGATLRGFPGHATASTGFLTGRDPDNWMTIASAQQGIVAFSSSVLSIVPYVGGGFSVDTMRRTWENRVVYDAGIKLVRPVIGGVAEAGVAQRRQHERLTGRVESEPIAYVNLWVGWNPRVVSSK